MKIDRETQKWLADLLGEGVDFDVPMAGHTSFRVGGPAPALARPGSLEVLKQVMSGLRDRRLPFMVIGGGTNLLVGDAGLRKIAIVLTNGLNTIRYSRENTDRPCIEAMAGARLSTVCRSALEQGFSGMEMALGIPGTVGGAVRMNAGTKGGAVGDVVCSVSFLLPDGRVETVPRKELDFRYRELRGLRGGLILGAHFGLRKNGASPDELKSRGKAILAERRRRQPAPVQGWSAGCFFKNPPDAPPAGALIDRAGLKGARVGGAMVSPRHANFILNTGKAKAADILALKAHIQETVYRQFGIGLSPEVEIVGEERPEA